MKNVAVIDYGMCNLDSIARAIALCGEIQSSQINIETLSKQMRLFFLV